ncbi:hypothetical protein MAPG_01640 [Magnaporthiopsis poae ATCC 64411]|uniref:Uncharacterized protein n=1 Tax=Magnaporthiopsis poae (strain ATCC 64411 / 73-15) TaxID=644358 RepID=A0A0C4DP84_MAGP6|nr:hypothetical protein MAPG_01640 [Magnaporthiopsis poae ATCC 64411]
MPYALSLLIPTHLNNRNGVKAIPRPTTLMPYFLFTQTPPHPAASLVGIYGRRGKGANERTHRRPPSEAVESYREAIRRTQAVVEDFERRNEHAVPPWQTRS